jgi:predicted nucleic acid-binding protein
MIKVLADTNVVLDALAAREPFRENAEKIFLLAAQEQIEGYITANCVTDIYYIIRKKLPAAEAHEALRYLFSVFFIIDTGSEDCKIALDSSTGDFEDALMETCAIKTRVDYIISRDDAFLKAADQIPVLSPASFLRLM